MTFRPVLLAEALPFGAVLAALGAGAFLAAGAAKLAAGLPKSVSCGMGLEPRATAAAKRAGGRRGMEARGKTDFFVFYSLFVVLLSLQLLLILFFCSSATCNISSISSLIGCCRLPSSHGLAKRRSIGRHDHMNRV